MQLFLDSNDNVNMVMGGEGMDRGAQRLLGLQGLLWQLLDNVHLSKSIQHTTLTVSPEEACTSAGHVSVLAP